MHAASQADPRADGAYTCARLDRTLTNMKMSAANADIETVENQKVRGWRPPPAHACHKADAYTIIHPRAWGRLVAATPSEGHGSAPVPMALCRWAALSRSIIVAADGCISAAGGWVTGWLAPPLVVHVSGEPRLVLGGAEEGAEQSVVRGRVDRPCQPVWRHVRPKALSHPRE
jgi:hypothetical protein